MEAKQSQQDVTALPPDTVDSRDHAIAKAEAELYDARQAYDEVILGAIVCSGGKNPVIDESVNERICTCKSRVIAAQSAYTMVFSGLSHFTPYNSA
jgi:hypothetical protein